MSPPESSSAVQDCPSDPNFSPSGGNSKYVTTGQKKSDGDFVPNGEIIRMLTSFILVCLCFIFVFRVMCYLFCISNLC
jgi:hypothetical protein